MWSPMGPHFLGWIIKNEMYVKLGRYVLLDLIMGTTLGRQAAFLRLWLFVWVPL